MPKMEAVPAVNELLAFVSALARDAGAILRERFGQPHQVQFKGVIDLVTEADKASEALIAERITASYPDHDLLGEEGARNDRSKGLGSEYRWVVDPLDGTTNFAHNMPTFAVSIGLERAGAPLLGAIYDPMRDELFLGVTGHGATLNGSPIQPSSVTDLIGSMLATGFSYDLPARERQAVVWKAFVTQVQAVRQTGSSALNLCYVAAGRLDGYWERGISPWDTAAGAAIVLAAGGSISGFTGEPFRSDNRVVVASNGALHAAMIATISSNEPPA